MNPTGTADAAYDCLLGHRMKQVDMIVQGMQLVATLSRQQTDKLVHATITITMTDVKPDLALGMIMPRCVPGFFLGTKVFTNAGEAAGQLICDQARLTIAVDYLKRQMVLLPPDYLHGANGTDQKPVLYVTVRVVKFLPDKPKLFIDEQKKEGYRKLDPYHLNAQALNQYLGGPLCRSKKGPTVTTQAKLSRSWDCTHGLII